MSKTCINGIDCNCCDFDRLKEIYSRPAYVISLVEGSSSIEYLVPKGWECPKCGLVNSPSVSFCPCSKINSSVPSSSKNEGGPKDDIWKDWKEIGRTDDGNILLMLDGEKEKER